MPGSLHIITLIKWVPDAQLERAIGDDRRILRSEGILGELDEYPLEAALQIKENGDAASIRVSALTMGPAAASIAVKKALQIGADDGFHLDDEALAAADIYATSTALAAAIAAVRDQDAENYLVLTGMASDDGESGAVPAQLAARLGIPALTQARGVVLEQDRLVVERISGTRQQKIAAPLPAVVSVTDQANDPRYPNFRAIMKAKKKPVTALSLADLGMTGYAVESKISTITAEPRPEREAGELIHDHGDAGQQLVGFLAEEGLL